MEKGAPSQRVLIVDDDEGVRNFISRGLSRAGFTTVTAEGGVSGIAQLSSHSFDAVVCDLNMPDQDGLEVLRFNSTLSPRPAFIVLTGFGSITVAVEAMKRGAADFIEKPVAIEVLRAAIISAIKRPQKEKSARASGLIGAPSWLDPFMQSLQRIASRESTVLLEGETGTGKSAVAKEIWRLSARSKGPFVETNCAAIPENLMESELFGHKKGSFTGATTDFEGRVGQAGGGTLFLDEIGEMKLELQSKLLHLLQQKTYTPIGSTKQEQADVRFIAATNKNLENEVETGKFRGDLYYRLNVVSLTIPPLRDRREDIPLLVEHFRATLAEREKEAPPVFAEETMELMKRYSWRGNVRELENLVERMAVIHGSGTVIQPAHLPPRMRDEGGVSSSRQTTPVATPVMVLPQATPVMLDPQLDNVSLGEAVQLYEKRRIQEALASSGGNRSQAARKLGLKRTTLIEKMKKLGVSDPETPDEGV